MNEGASPRRKVEIDQKKAKAIADALEKTYKGSDELPFNPASDKIVVFSDLHKGSGDHADDFRLCEHAFTMALGWYLENGYKLFLLGDTEELWEENPEAVFKQYPEVFRLEAEFREPGRGGLERFWGNHDDLWGSGRNVRKHLERPDLLGPGLNVREGLRLKVARPGGGTGTIFFAHGHQGTGASDKFSGLARLPVRHIWRRIQRKTGYSATSPAREFGLRDEHDLAMTLWAVRKRVVLVTGHTHRPVFAVETPDPPPTRAVATLTEALAAAGDPAEKGSVRGELEYSHTANRRPLEVVTVTPPCYFNTGCCAFPDGDITGLELADNEIRLVRWPAVFPEICKPGVPGISAEKRLLAGASRSIEDVLAAVEQADPSSDPLNAIAITPG